MRKIDTTVIYDFLIDNYLAEKGKILFALEGASGSSKTWSGIDFILQYCRINAGKGKRIIIGRETYRDCLDTICYDFIKRLKDINWYNKDYHSLSHPQKYILFGNRIEFTGWSNNGQPSKRQDVLWFNEILESDEELFKQYNQRTNEITMCDWNPKVTEHWVYNVILKREDCKYRLCLMPDNPYLPDGQRMELLKYEPTLENIQNGTADEYMYNVYVLGKRGDPKGVIFKNITWIDEFPSNIHYDYGIDFGFTTDPTVIVKAAEDADNIWAECLLYNPVDNVETLDGYANEIGINKKLPSTADSADKYVGVNGSVEMVKGLSNLGWNISKVKKNQSVMYWINSMKKKKIHIVRNNFFTYLKKEVDNYKLREINGLAVNQPIDKFNHFWDALRYRHMAFNIGDEYEYC